MSDWGAIVVAGGTCDPDLERRIGSPRKALATFAGRRSLEWTLEAVRSAGLDNCVTVGGADLAPYVSHGILIEEVGSAVENAVAAASKLCCSRLLILPADLPLLRGEMIQAFLEKVDARRSAEVWYSAGLCTEAAYLTAFPTAATSPLRLIEGPYLSGGFFATSQQGLLRGQELFQAIRRSRKSQLQMALKFGLPTAVKYFLRRFSLTDAEVSLGRVLEGQVILVTDAHPASALDFDSPADVDTIEALLTSD